MVVVRRGGRFLTIRRAPGILAGGAWCFVGGAIKPGESQPDAVVREFAEELGARVRPERKIWAYTRSDGTLMLHWWSAQLLDEVLRPNPKEVAEVKWLTLDEIEALAHVLDSNLVFIRQVRRGLLDEAGR